MLRQSCDVLIHADGKYAPCQGCFGCWTKHPVECFMKDRLQQVCRIVGKADVLIIVTENLYGSYSPNVKAVLDRSIGLSTPLSTWRGKQMHHTLRYGKHSLLQLMVYGTVTEQEKGTFIFMAKKNALNFGYAKSEVIFLNTLNAFDQLGVKKLPKVKDLSAEYAQVLAEKKATYVEYRAARSEMQEYQKARHNVEMF